jgi:hypothetical protein
MRPSDFGFCVQFRYDADVPAARKNRWVFVEFPDGKSHMRHEAEALVMKHLDALVGQTAITASVITEDEPIPRDWVQTKIDGEDHVLFWKRPGNPPPAVR